MNYQIDESYTSDLLNVSLDNTDSILTQRHSVITKTHNLNEQISNKKTLWDIAIENEKYKLTKISADNERGVITISPYRNGKIKEITTNKQILIEATSLVLVNSECDIQYSKKEFYINKNLNLLIIDNFNSLFINGYDDIIEIELDENQRTIINENYLIGFEESVETQKIAKHPDSTHALSGPGKIYLHTQNILNSKYLED